MDTNNTSRRSLLGSIALVAPVALLAASAAASARPSSAMGRLAWNNAMRAHIEAKRASDAFDAVYNRAADAYEAASPDESMIDWREFPFRHRAEVMRTLDLDAYEADLIASEGKLWSATPAHRESRFAAVATVREYRRLDKLADEQTGYTVTAARFEELMDASYAATWALFEIPAPDMEAFNWKLEHLFGDKARNEGGCPAWAEEVMQTFMADARRLLSQAA